MSDLLFPTFAALRVVDRVPLFDTTVQAGRSASEYRIKRRNVGWRYTVEVGLRSWLNEDEALQHFFHMHSGRHGSFLWRDPEDYAVTDHGFGVGDGATLAFRLQRALSGQVTDILGAWSSYTKARTNHLLQSQTFDNASWTKRATHAVSSATDQYAPDGTATADIVTATAGIAGQGLYQESAASGNAAYTFSIWLRASSLTSAHICVKDRATDTIRAQSTVTLSTSWQRFTVTGTTAGATTGLRVELSAAGSGTFYAWGAQVEAVGPYTTPTRYIPTTSAAVRSDPSYWPSEADGFAPVLNPAPGIIVYKDGVAQALTAYTLGASGAITFGVAPAAGAQLSWTGSYYKRVRFDDDELDLRHEGGGLWTATVELVSVVS